MSRYHDMPLHMAHCYVRWDCPPERYIDDMLLFDFTLSTMDAREYICAGATRGHNLDSGERFTSPVTIRRPS